MLTVRVRNMRVEEHEYAIVCQVALSKPVLVQAMDLWICKDVTHTLKIYYQHVTLSQLP